jgi:hypothetical protein
MESPSPSAKIRARQRARLRREIVKILQREMAIVSHQRWEELPDLKRRKVMLASKLHGLSVGPGDAALPKGLLISQLEEQSSRQIRAQMDLIGRQIIALQELRQYWMECLNVSFGKYC